MSQAVNNSLFSIGIVEVRNASRTTAGTIEIKHLNNAAATLLGYTKEELVDKSLDLILVSDVQAGLLKASIQRMDSSENDTFQCELINKSGLRSPVTVTLLSMGDERNHIALLI